MGTAQRQAEPRRADAVRNVERIVEAATRCLGTRPDATMADIAKAAGLGRVTVYGHFASRAELVEAVLVRVLEQGDRVLAGVDLDGEPYAALAALLRSSWLEVDQARSVLAAAESELSPARIQELHAGAAARMDTLVRRGQDEGAFRADLPASWLVAVIHRIVHGAADEIAAGRLERGVAADYVVATVLAVVAPPGGEGA